MTNLFSLEGKNAWVTGACYGIGFAIAKAFAQAGAKTIIFNARHEEGVAKAIEDYKAAGIENVKGYVCDVTDEKAVKELDFEKAAEYRDAIVAIENRIREY
jgi:gluconate 5-dehydrogenase